MTTPPRLIDAFIDRLIELAAGAEPHDRDYGMCWDIWNNVHWALCDQMMHQSLRRLYGSAFDPLGDLLLKGDHWSGPRGKRRRQLCYDVAVQAMASAGGDYRGKYQ